MADATSSFDDWEATVLIRFGYEISISCPTPVSMLLALSPHTEFSDPMVGNFAVQITPEVPISTYVDTFGNRISRVVAPQGQSVIWADCFTRVSGAPDVVVLDAPEVLVKDLPSETLLFLASSRYCESDELGGAAWRMFGGLTPGWNRVQAICDYVHNEITFNYKFGRVNKTADDVYREKSGVCRDFAHLSIAFCRAMNIPARYVSGYLGDIGVPPSGAGDFCAWFEVYLGDRWYTFDARYNMPRIGRIAMVRGRDAADVAMITSFGPYDLTGFKVWTDETPDEPGGELLRKLETRPEAVALIPPTSARLSV